MLVHTEQSASLELHGNFKLKPENDAKKKEEKVITNRK